MKADNAAMEPKEPTIIFEDEDILLINKPEGWLVHEDGKADNSPIIVDWFLKRVPAASGVGEAGYSTRGQELNRSGVVHRLDKETSGILVLAKNQTAHQFLKKQFKDRSVYKEYRAFVYGQIHDRWGTINRPIGRNTRDHRLRSAMKGAKGTLREAITDLERIGVGEYEGEPFSYLKLIPKTGRTHQLRVHLRAIDRPIVGDTAYAAYKLEGSNNLELKRMALHAYILEFNLLNGSRERFIAPVPQVFEEAAERIAE